MISVVGRGTFAKVFLVHLPTNQKYYALKSMRKDVIIDKNSLENINLERLIMLQVGFSKVVSRTAGLVRLEEREVGTQPKVQSRPRR